MDRPIDSATIGIKRNDVQTHRPTDQDNDVQMDRPIDPATSSIKRNRFL